MLAFSKIESTCYGHLYGIVNGVINSSRKVICCKEINLIVRKVRAPLEAYDPAKGGFIDDFASYVRKQQIIYLIWLKDLLQLTKLKPENVCFNYYKRFVLYGMLHSPLKTTKTVVNQLVFYIHSYFKRKNNEKYNSDNNCL